MKKRGFTIGRFLGMFFYQIYSETGGEKIILISLHRRKACLKTGRKISIQCTLNFMQ